MEAQMQYTAIKRTSQLWIPQMHISRITKVTKALLKNTPKILTLNNYMEEAQRRKIRRRCYPHRRHVRGVENLPQKKERKNNHVAVQKTLLF